MTDKLREAAEEHVIKLRKERLIKEDWLSLCLFDHNIKEVFIAGANYQKPITRQETIAEMIALLRSEDCVQHSDLACADDYANWLERAMEGKEK